MAPADEYRDIPTDVKEFLARSIMALNELEIVLFLQRSAARSWTAHEVANTLYLTEESTQERLDVLTERQLLQKTDGSPPSYRYAPADQGVEETVQRLATLYRERRTTIVSLIFAKPVDRIRTFADAFKLRRDD